MSINSNTIRYLFIAFITMLLFACNEISTVPAIEETGVAVEEDPVGTESPSEGLNKLLKTALESMELGFTTLINTPIEINLNPETTGQDTPIYIEVMEQPEEGELTGQLIGYALAMQYRPRQDYEGSDSIDFRLSAEDASGNQATIDSSVRITIISSESGTDRDGDGLTDFDEINVYQTSPDIADTDGDGFSDGTEIVELAFNAAINNYRFNPLISDLPQLDIDIATVPLIILNYTDNEGESMSVSNERGGETIRGSVFEVTNEFYAETSISIEMSVGVTVGTENTGEISTNVGVSVTGGASHSKTQSDSREDSRSFNQIIENSSETARETDGGRIRVGVTIANEGNITYSLDHLTLAVSYYDSTASRRLPVATLSYNTGTSSEFPATSFEPGEESSILIFENNDLDLETAMSLLGEASAIDVRPALFSISDASGTPLDFNTPNRQSRTADIIIDYGAERPIEQYSVAVIGAHGDTPVNTIDLSTILGIVDVDFAESTESGVTRLSQVRNVASIAADADLTDNVLTDRRWNIVVFSDNGLSSNTTVYDSGLSATNVVNSYSLDNINISAGDRIALTFLIDDDNDGVGLRQELIAGTDPESADTDSDGISDFDEINIPRTINAINIIDPQRYPVNGIFTNPVIADIDEDNVNDYDELFVDFTDPFNADTDGDGIQDDDDTFPGVRPGSGITFTTARITQSDQLNNGLKEFRFDASVSYAPNTVFVDAQIDWGDGSSATITTSQLANFSVAHLYGVFADGYTPTLTVNGTVDGVAVSESISGYIRNYSNAAETVSDFTLAQGWDAGEEIRTIADLNGDGNIELIAFGTADTSVLETTVNADGTVLISTSREIISSSFGTDYTNVHNSPRFIRDMNNDGIMDIIGFRSGGNNGVFLSLGSGTSGLPTYPTPTEVINTWASGPAVRHPIFIDDLNSDGRLDLVGFDQFSSGEVGSGSFTDDGTVSFLLGADNDFPQGIVASSDLGIAGGWDNNDHYRFLADLNSDGFPDLVVQGVGNDISYAMGNGDGTFANRVALDEGTAELQTSPIDPEQNPIFIEDMDNDGHKDIVVIFDNSIVVYINEIDTSTSDTQFRSGQNWSNGSQEYTQAVGWIGEQQATGGDSYGQYMRNQRYIIDMDADGYKDIVGFGTSVVTWARNLTGEGESRFDLSNLSTLAREGTASYDSTSSNSDDGNYGERFVQDFNNDGIPDVLGFSNDGPRLYLTPKIDQPIIQ